jgi:ComF family protein
MIAFTKKWLKSVAHFVFPYHCVSCQKELPDEFNLICPICISDFSYTYFETYQEETPLDKVFFGRVQLVFTYAYLYFQKGSNTQNMIHAIKYKNNKTLARVLGSMCGANLLKINELAIPDAFISVPLHPKKEFMRGYNQGSEIAIGLAESTPIPFAENVLLRKVFTETQTKKGKYERWSNVETVFTVKEPEKWKGKHLCLVDDVITTGSTLEACVRVLQEEIPDVRVSVVALAFAK